MALHYFYVGRNGVTSIVLGNNISEVQRERRHYMQAGYRVTIIASKESNIHIVKLGSN